MPTKTQSKVLRFIKTHIAANGYPPTRAEISANFGWSSANAAQDHLNALVRRGLVRVTPGIARGISVV